MRKFRKKHTLRNILILILILFLAAILTIEFQMKPLFSLYSQHYAQVMATEAINEAVTSELENQGYTYGDLATVQYSSDGKIQGITTNVVNINKLKAAVTTAAQDKISTVQQKDVWICLGDLSGFGLLKGTGPKVRLNLGLTGSILTDFESSFSAAGINQTLHTITIDITADLYLTSLSENTELKINTSMPVAETVLMGSTPGLYMDKTN